MGDASIAGMGVRVEVDFDQIQTTIDSLLAALADLQEEGQSLDTASQLLLAAWSGEAADAYDARHSEWQTDQRYTLDELTAAITALQRSLAHYRGAEATILDLIG